jgi:capsular exopolysaccharide synthesis family protein
MGRIDEALRRVAEEPGDSASATIPGTTKASTDAFVSPWAFDTTGDTAAAPPSDVPTEISAPPAAPAAELAPANRHGHTDTAFGPLRTASGAAALRNERLVLSPDAPPEFAEQFRRLAATLHHAQLVNGLKVVMVTSARPGDGKSLTAANLALTLSESYRREVLLIDADLRRPSLHEVFGVPNVAGLSDGLLLEEDERLAAVKLTSTLTLLPAGRPVQDPMGGLTSARMRKILEEAAARFEWVILDTVPVGLLADASILAGMVDGALVVVRAGETPHSALAKAVDVLTRDKIIGVVLNGTEQPSTDPKLSKYYSGAVPNASS